MIEVYRKRGSIVRYENGVLVRVREAGRAVEEGAFFRCTPAPGTAPLPEKDAGDVLDAVRRIESVVSAPLRIERLIVTDGSAEHELGERRWSDKTGRIHLSIVHRAWRVLIDEGSLEGGGIESIAGAFARLEGEREAPPRLRLAPRVTAALTPSLFGVDPPNVRLEQVAGGVDGKGEPIGAVAAPPWPNWYRPSYRVRPQRTALNVAVRCSVSVIEEGLPQAIAVLEPPRGLDMRLLCVDGGHVFITTVRVVRIEAVAEPSAWYPFAAGVWAGEAEVVS
ncbi:MAG TPA: hypothetical protein VNA04_01435 [Thermoanaerobaculia bacterium]|nr:hypothetical protein [Thermoanaerobaculia bacterium]